MYLEIKQYFEKLEDAIFNFEEHYERTRNKLFIRDSYIDEEFPNEIGDSKT